MEISKLPEFYRGKRVFVTGFSGFKGVWLTKILTLWGAEVTGYALEPSTAEGRMFLEESGVLGVMTAHFGDIRDRAALQAAFAQAEPEIVLHLAAQPLVIDSYREPAYTYETNVMGTVNILECVRQSSAVRSFLNVTTDKVYENKEWPWGYRENEPLDGYDPYSNSKSCSELVTHSYAKSFFTERDIAISTARAGNVIGGGDFSANRIIPDCVRAALSGAPIQVRNPYSTRPYQHVLEPLLAYLLLAAAGYEDKKYAGWYNVGPDDVDCVSTGELVDLFCRTWGEGLTWENISTDGPHEAGFLKLDSSKLKRALGWRPRLHIEGAIARTVEWVKSRRGGESMAAIMARQIADFVAVD